MRGEGEGLGPDPRPLAVGHNTGTDRSWNHRPA